MSRTLNLVDRLLARGRKLQALGRSQDALHVFGRLAGFRELPAEAAEETQATLAEIYRRYRNHEQVRRHLASALAYQPTSARYHYLMANALDLDEQGDPERAYEHYRRSLQLDPDQPQCLGEFGLLALSLGKDEEGIGALRRAVELAPDDPEAVGNLVEGLLELGEPEEARHLLQAALFRHPRHLGFRKLWSDFRFQQACEEQHAARQSSPSYSAENDKPTILPFVRLAPQAPKTRGRKLVRRDGPAAPKPPHPPRHSQYPDRKHA
jgi:tetratricopeptide (TPR) repeat protein